MFVAVTSSSNLVRFFTKFTDETFAALVACIFCVESAKKIIMMFFNSSISSTLAMGSAMVALVTLGSAVAISNFKRSPYGPEGVRNLIGDFAPTIAVAVGVVFAQWLAGNYGFSFEALSLPASLAPSARPWMTDIMAVPNNIKLVGPCRPRVRDPPLHGPEHHHPPREQLRGSQEARCLPPRHVLALPHHRGHLHLRSPLDLRLHRALHHPRQVPHRREAGPRDRPRGGHRRHRDPLDSLVLNLLIGASIIFLKPVLAQIPMCVLSGIFFYLGLAAMRGNEFLERVGMTLITDPEQMPKSHPLVSGGVKLDVLKKFTIMQIVCLGMMWWVKGSPAAMLFPILIAALGPVRIVAGKAGWFTQEELNLLDEQVETDPGYVKP